MRARRTKSCQVLAVATFSDCSIFLLINEFGHQSHEQDIPLCTSAANALKSALSRNIYVHLACTRTLSAYTGLRQLDTRYPSGQTYLQTIKTWYLSVRQLPECWTSSQCANLMRWHAKESGIGSPLKNSLWTKHTVISLPFTSTTPKLVSPDKY